MATTPVKLITDKQRLMGGISIFEPHNSNKRIIRFGPTGTVDFTPTLTEIESRSDETGISLLIGSWVSQGDGAITIADMPMWTSTTYESMFLAKRTYRKQSAVASRTLLLEDLKADLNDGDVIQIDGIRPTIISITDGSGEDAVEYIEDEIGIRDGEAGNYTFHQDTGILEFFSKPDGASADILITYSLPAITEADKLVEFEVMTTSGIRGKYTLLGVVDGGLPGQVVDYIFPDVEFRPNGAVNLKGVDALNVASLTGRVYKSADYGYGYVRSRSAFN